MAKSKTAPRGGNFISTVVFFIIGAMFLVLGIYANVRAGHLDKVCTEEIEGTVKSIYSREEVRRTGKHTYREINYYITVQYQYDDTFYTLSPNDAVSRDRYRKGDRVTVMLNPDDPSEVCLKGKTRGMRISFIMLMIFCGGFWVMSAVLLIKDRMALKK